MPQFLFIDLPNFRIRDAHGHGVSLSYKQLGQVIAQYHYVRSGLRSTEYADLCASLVFAAGETDIWTSYTTSTTAAAAPATTGASSSSRAHGSGSRSSNSTAAAAANTMETTTMIHAEENMLLAYHQSFDSPGAYPIVDALLLSSKPCPNCLGYFIPPSPSGKTCRLPGIPKAFKAKFTPRSDRTYTPVFYLSSAGRGEDPTAGYELWLQLGGMWAIDFVAEGTLASSPEVARGQVYYLMMTMGQEHGAAPWFALNEQESMTDAEVAEAILRQGLAATYWIGR